MEPVAHSENGVQKEQPAIISSLAPITSGDEKERVNVTSTNNEGPLSPEIVIAPASTEEAPQPRKRFQLPSNRLLSLDLLRGLAILLMIVCNSQNGPEVFDILEHPEWIGFSIADSVFPSFLFISGVAIPLAMRGPSKADPSYDLKNPGRFYLRQALRVFKRALAIMCLGYVNALYGLVIRGVGGDKFRWPGVLQRIGFCYGVVAWMHLLVLYRGRKPDAPVSIAYLLPSSKKAPATPPKELELEQEEEEDLKKEKASSLSTAGTWPWFAQVSLPYWLPVSALLIWLIATYSVQVEGCPERAMISDPQCSPQAYFDLKIFGTAHTYRHLNFDPEGSLSTLTSLLNVWFGWFVGVSVREFNAQIKQIRLDFQVRREATKATSNDNDDQESSLQDQVLEQEMVVRSYMNLLGEWFWWGTLWTFVGWFFSLGLPLSKPSWTATFAVMSSGLSQAVLSVLFFKFDAQPQIKKLTRLHKEHQSLTDSHSATGSSLDPEQQRLLNQHQHSTLLNVYYAFDRFCRHWFRWSILLILGSMGRNAILLYMCSEISLGTSFLIRAGPVDPETDKRPDLYTSSFEYTWGKLNMGGWGSLFYSLGFAFLHICLAIFLDYKKWYFKV
ncbi:hypothetical protein BGZ94_008479 [Podila epigama]|nr:hypothetical protein BGZ94_008479 [Podila epigama]